MQSLLKKRYRERLFTEQEFHKASRLDKIYMHLLEPTKWTLNEDAAKHLDRLRQVWAIMMDNAVQRARIRLIADMLGIDLWNEKQIVRLMDDATLLFGDILKSNRSLDRAIIRERLVVLAEKCTEAKDYEGATKAWAQIIKLEGFDRPDQSFTPEDVQLPAITFTSDPLAISGNSEAIEDAEIVEEDILEQQAVDVSPGEAAD